MIEIAPSIIAADYARLHVALAAIEEGGADMVHVDVMDGHFVPNITIGPPVAASLAAATRLPLDCHLMIEFPERFIPAFIEAGARRITIHQEACLQLDRAIRAIRDAGAEAGVALEPATPVETLDDVLTALDVVLIMSVNPGFSGQAFIESSIEKVRRTARRIAERGASATIQVDGGIDRNNIGLLAAAGATRFVAGSSVFGATDVPSAIRELRTSAETVLR